MNRASDLRGQSAEELKKELMALRRTQLKMRIQLRTGQLADMAKFRDCRRDIARIKTVLNEQQRSG